MREFFKVLVSIAHEVYALLKFSGMFRFSFIEENAV